MEWLARSRSDEKGFPEQTYARHITGVEAYASLFLKGISPFISNELQAHLMSAVPSAARFHDLGKLEDSNQKVLRGEVRKAHLPYPHQDAGVALLLQEPMQFFSATLVASHHRGLPDLSMEGQKQDAMMRVSEEKKHTDDILPELLMRHKSIFRDDLAKENEPPLPEEIHFQMSLRMGLSILADADFTDSSQPNRSLEEIGQSAAPELRAEERLAAQDRYLGRLPKNDERSALRTEVYACCRKHPADAGIYACDSPVGTGKTTAVMANLLATAAKRQLRRIFIVLPFTSIIRQSVEVYRDALVQPGEKPEDVVAEIHHLVDFEDPASREFAACWHAPVIVTTAVAFFETLAAATPAGLRRLHQLVGSGIFVDEAHAAQPVKLLPMAWYWIKCLSQDWSCYWILASGSLNRFWKIADIDPATPDIPELVPETVRAKCAAFEGNRVQYVNLDVLTVDQLRDHVASVPGPRLVILNTVQNAAIVASSFLKSGRFDAVFHLSTALTPVDREATLEIVQAKMKEDPNGNWVLVGTSCIEAGLNFDFASGFRENASLVSLLQASGRVNRSGKRENAQMFMFHLNDDGNALTRNRQLEDSEYVLENRIIKAGKTISQNLCTWAMEEELKQDTARGGKDKIMDAETCGNFPEVEMCFKVIASNTDIVLTNPELIARIEAYESVSWQEIQRNSVQIWDYKLKDLKIPEVNGHPGLYKWNLKYDDFLGYMAGIVENQKLFRNGGVL